METTVFEREVTPHLEAVENKAVSSRERLSATQWIFNPFSHCNTGEWSQTTGIMGKDIDGKKRPGLVKVGELQRIDNALQTVNNAKESTLELIRGGATIYKQDERFAYHIAREIESAFPGKVKVITSLAGETDDEKVARIQAILLGEDMEAAIIPNEALPVPIMTKMRERLRYNLREISRAPQTEMTVLLVKVGRELDQAIMANIRYAEDQLKEAQAAVQDGRATGFDIAAQRCFLALGREVPDTLNRVAHSQLSPGLPQAVHDPRMTALLEHFDKKTPEVDNSITRGGKADAEHFAETDSRTGADFPIADIPPGVAASSSSALATAGTEDFPLIKEDDMEILKRESGGIFKGLDKEVKEAVAEREEAFKKGEPMPEPAEDEIELDNETISSTAKNAKKTSTTPLRCKGETLAGEQCKKDAVTGSKYCNLHG